MSSAKIIVNPAAGAGKTAKIWPRIMSFLKKSGMRFEHDLTEAPGHAVELAKSATNKGFPLVVSVGGDGTINEIVNGVYEAGGIRDVALGIIGTGTGTDYLRSIGIPRDYKDACLRLMNRKEMVFDLGLVECTNNGHPVRRLFVNFAGLGFDAEVVRATTQRFKSLGSRTSYLMGLFSTLAFYRNRELSLELDGQAEHLKACTVVLSNGKYGGGSMLIAPQADLQDGFLDVLTIGDLSKPDLLMSLPRIYKGTHLTHSKVTAHRAREIRVKTIRRTAVQADGELLGETPARFQILPATLTLVV